MHGEHLLVICRLIAMWTRGISRRKGKNGGREYLSLEAMKRRVAGETETVGVQQSSPANAVTNNMHSQNIIIPMTASWENALQLVFI